MPLPPPPEGGAHAFVSFQPDGVTPVAYDPCRPVHYVIRPDSAPPGGEELVREAVARISQVTGLQFVYRGATDEAPGPERELFQPDRYGRRWAPVLIAWETEEAEPGARRRRRRRGRQRAGVPRRGPTGLPHRHRLAGRPPVRRRSSAAAAAGASRGRSSCTSWATSWAWAHVDDEQQLMFPEARREVPDFAAGDLTGLAVLGAGVCVPEL